MLSGIMSMAVLPVCIGAGGIAGSSTVLALVARGRLHGSGRVWIADVEPDPGAQHDDGGRAWYPPERSR